VYPSESYYSIKPSLRVKGISIFLKVPVSQAKRSKGYRGKKAVSHEGGLARWRLDWALYRNGKQRLRNPCIYVRLIFSNVPAIVQVYVEGIDISLPYISF
jgi:hypothetical protein